MTSRRNWVSPSHVSWSLRGWEAAAAQVGQGCPVYLSCDVNPLCHMGVGSSFRGRWEARSRVAGCEGKDQSIRSSINTLVGNRVETVLINRASFPHRPIATVVLSCYFSSIHWYLSTYVASPSTHVEQHCGDSITGSKRFERLALLLSSVVKVRIVVTTNAVVLDLK